MRSNPHRHLTLHAISKLTEYRSVETGRLVFVDAQAVEAAQAHAQAQSGRSILPPTSPEEDKEMAAFQSMLQEYLSREFAAVWPMQKKLEC